MPKVGQTACRAVAAHLLGECSAKRVRYLDDLAPGHLDDLAPARPQRFLAEQIYAYQILDAKSLSAA